jgi:hypothetical protein
MLPTLVGSYLAENHILLLIQELCPELGAKPVLGNLPPWSWMQLIVADLLVGPSAQHCSWTFRWISILWTRLKLDDLYQIFYIKFRVLGD